MKKHLLLLFLFTTTLALAKENYIPFNNSEIILSINGKELEIVFDIENLSPIVELKKSDEKTNSILDFNLSEEKLILSHEDYKKGSYILTIDDEVRTEEILLKVADKAFKIIDRRLINKPIFQFSDNKFRVIVLENDIPIIVSIESLSEFKFLKFERTFLYLLSCFFAFCEAFSPIFFHSLKILFGISKGL